MLPTVCAKVAVKHQSSPIIIIIIIIIIIRRLTCKSLYGLVCNVEIGRSISMNASAVDARRHS